MRDITIREFQDYIRSKDNRTELADRYFIKLTEEVGELAEAVLRDRHLGEAEVAEKRGTIEEEIYDVLYYLTVLANLHHVDLTRAAYLKEQFNQQRFGLDNTKNGAYGTGTPVINLFEDAND
ncbi:MAG: MazG nucleotide pyrophosphohydrolase domain-containing protein [Christensenellales bacterium]|jgi:NTP pyrophosphatase (non-canonical NTP hydrolase)